MQTMTKSATYKDFLTVCKQKEPTAPGTPGVYQKLVADYHDWVEFGGHHSGPQPMNMFDFHSGWHGQEQNIFKAPVRPADQPYAPYWHRYDAYGQRFLEMHHNMLYGRGEISTDPSVLPHPGYFVWLETIEQSTIAPPSQWIPGMSIPAEIRYEPDPLALSLSLLQTRIRTYMTDTRCKANGTPVLPKSLIDTLRRAPNQHNTLRLPLAFSRAGATVEADREPETGHWSLADFKSVEQLGCCLTRYHANWHVNIGGVMPDLATSIADPIFYYGVHTVIDQVYVNFLQLQAEKADWHYVHRGPRNDGRGHPEVHRETLLRFKAAQQAIRQNLSKRR